MLVQTLLITFALPTPLSPAYNFQTWSVAKGRHTFGSGSQLAVDGEFVADDSCLAGTDLIWAVDLGASYDVIRVKLWLNLNLADVDRGYGFNLYVSSDAPVTSAGSSQVALPPSAAPCNSPASPDSTQQVLVLTCDDDTHGRYVYVVTDDSPHTFCEVEVIATPVCESVEGTACDFGDESSQFSCGFVSSADSDRSCLASSGVNEACDLEHCDTWNQVAVACGYSGQPVTLQCNDASLGLFVYSVRFGRDDSEQCLDQPITELDTTVVSNWSDVHQALDPPLMATFSTACNNQISCTLTLMESDFGGSFGAENTLEIQYGCLYDAFEAVTSEAELTECSRECGGGVTIASSECLPGPDDPCPVPNSVQATPCNEQPCSQLIENAAEGAEIVSISNYLDGMTSQISDPSDAVNSDCWLSDKYTGGALEAKPWLRVHIGNSFRVGYVKFRSGLVPLTTPPSIHGMYSLGETAVFVSNKLVATIAEFEGHELCGRPALQEAGEGVVLFCKAASPGLYLYFMYDGPDAPAQPRVLSVCELEVVPTGTQQFLEMSESVSCRGRTDGAYPWPTPCSQEYIVCQDGVQYNRSCGDGLLFKYTYASADNGPVCVSDPGDCVPAPEWDWSFHTQIPLDVDQSQVQSSSLDERKLFNLFKHNIWNVNTTGTVAKRLFPSGSPNETAQDMDDRCWDQFRCTLASLTSNTWREYLRDNFGATCSGTARCKVNLLPYSAANGPITFKYFNHPEEDNLGLMQDANLFDMCPTDYKIDDKFYYCEEGLGSYKALCDCTAPLMYDEEVHRWYHAVMRRLDPRQVLAGGEGSEFCANRYLTVAKPKSQHQMHFKMFEQDASTSKKHRGARGLSQFQTASE